ncbi:putative monooxygenase p33MONOX [Scophthalmus maximus]|uniref:Putative monooxygenase p33MONOX n=1 Tax=Scophthalmus maximus TaxID=52904 RepID=A0A2U9C8U6_SCOMX|nr:putative monooxygenase p33MONOX [Scophthalmus maximus]
MGFRLSAVCSPGETPRVQESWTNRPPNKHAALVSLAPETRRGCGASCSGADRAHRRVEPLSESPVATLSDLVSKWPQDGETFQVSEIVTVCKIKHSSNISVYFHISAIDLGTSSSIFGVLSSPLGITRHNMSYDEHMDTPMNSPPPDMTVNMLWKDPVIPQHKFRNTAEEGEKVGKLVTFEAAAPAKSPVPVVKAKATSLMSSLMIKQTHENLQRFEHQAGLTDTRYTPHKGLSAEETRFHRLVDTTLPKLRMPSGDFKEDRLTTSAQSTPSGTPSVTPSVTPCVTPSVTPCVSPHTSPAVNRRTWFQLSPAPFLATPELSPNRSTDMGGNEGGDRWSFFGTRSVVQKSPTDPGSETSTGFSLQSYFGLHKSSTMDGTNTQVNLKVQDPANFMPPKIDISGIEGKQVPPRPHKLKPRDMNVLTPSGF